MKLFFAAPLSGLPSDPTALGAQASRLHFARKAVRAAPASSRPSFPIALPAHVPGACADAEPIANAANKTASMSRVISALLPSAHSPSSLLWERDDWLSCHDRSIGNASVKGAALDRIVVVARSQLRRLTDENRDVARAVAIEIFHAPRVLKFEVSREGEVTEFVRSELFGHLILNAFFLVQFRGMITARVKREFPLFFRCTFAMSFARGSLNSI